MPSFMTPGKFIILLTNLFYALGAYVFDWNETHVMNPKWPPHARFHNGQTMSLGVCLATTSLYFLFRTAPSIQQARDNLFSAAMIGSWYCLAGLSAAYYPGAKWSDLDTYHGEAPQRSVFIGVIVANWLGYALERRRLTRQKHE